MWKVKKDSTSYLCSSFTQKNIECSQYAVSFQSYHSGIYCILPNLKEIITDVDKHNG